MRITIVSDMNIKRKWRIIYRFSFVFFILNFFMMIALKKSSDFLFIGWVAVICLYTILILRIKWLYDNKKEKLM